LAGRPAPPAIGGPTQIQSHVRRDSQGVSSSANSVQSLLNPAENDDKGDSSPQVKRPKLMHRP
jgi:hypothetical protein